MKVPMRQWAQENQVPDRMIWRGGADSQIGTWLGLCGIIGSGLSYRKAMACLSVVSTHRSKSIDLPVVQYERPDLGLTLTMRDNFHDVKLSVESERPIGYADELACIFHTTPPATPPELNIGIKAIHHPGGASMVASLRERVIRICRGGGCRYDRKSRTVRMYLDSQP